MSYSKWTSSDFGNNQLLEIIDGDRGKNYPNGEDFQNAGYCIFLNTKNVTKTGFDFTEKMFITKEKDEVLRKGKLIGYDVVMTTRGTVGNIAYFDPKIKYKNMRINSGMVIIRANNLFLQPKFLYYILKNPITQEKIKQFSTGSAQPQLPISTIKKVDFSLPDLTTQKAIANILSSLDDKIELNNKINKNLEELAQTLYKQWFVDFDFPNVDGEPYKSSGGEMVESELGLIPFGWKIGTIESVCNTVLGGTPSRKREEFWNGDINWINSGEVNQFRIIRPSEMITKKGYENSSTKLMPKKTTVIAITGATLGAVSLLEIDSCANQSVIGILQNDNIKYSFIYPTMKNVIHNMIGRQTGGAQQHINKNDVNSYKIVVPDKHLLNRFHEVVDTIYNEIANRIFQNQKVSKLRDELLPKLLSGEIEVPIEE